MFYKGSEEVIKHPVLGGKLSMLNCPVLYKKLSWTTFDIIGKSAEHTSLLLKHFRKS